MRIKPLYSKGFDRETVLGLVIMKKSLISGFSTREVLALTGVTANSLRYWYDQGIIVPEKVPIGKGLRNTRFYTFTQLIEVKAIMALRSNVPIKTIRAVKTFISDHFEDTNIANKPLIVVNNGDRSDVYLQCDEKWYQKITGKNIGQITHLDLILIPSLKTQVDEVVENVKAGKCDTIDIQRFKSLLPSRHLSLVA